MERNEDSICTTEFTSGTVDGVSYPIPHRAPVTLRMAPDRDIIYLNRMPGPGGPRAFDTSVTPRFVVENSGDRQIDLEFPSGRQFDIVVEDEQGRVVDQWSANKRFSGVPSTTHLKPGEEAVFEGTVRLPERDGSYIVRMELNTQNRHFAAETSVQVLSVY